MQQLNKQTNKDKEESFFKFQADYFDDGSDQSLECMLKIIKQSEKKLINPLETFNLYSYKEILQLKAQRQNDDRDQDFKIKKQAKYDIYHIDAIDFCKYKNDSQQQYMHKNDEDYFISQIRNIQGQVQEFSQTESESDEDIRLFNSDEGEEQEYDSSSSGEIEEIFNQQDSNKQINSEEEEQEEEYDDDEEEEYQGQEDQVEQEAQEEQQEVQDLINQVDLIDENKVLDIEYKVENLDIENKNNDLYLMHNKRVDNIVLEKEQLNQFDEIQNQYSDNISDQNVLKNEQFEQPAQSDKDLKEPTKQLELQKMINTEIIQDNETTQQQIHELISLENQENDVEIQQKLQQMDGKKEGILKDVLKIQNITKECLKQYNNQSISQKYKNHISAQQFINQLNSNKFYSFFNYTIVKLCDVYGDEDSKIKKIEKIFKKNHFLPSDIIYQKQKISALKAFFILQMRILQKQVGIAECSTIEKLFLVFLFIHSIQLEMMLFVKQLPSYSIKSIIQSKIYDNPSSKVFLLMGETGSGKTTQIPQMLFALNNFYLNSSSLTKNSHTHQKILCVQPRKIACTTLYERVSQEALEYRDHVGFYIGNLPNQQNYKNASIIFLTEQIFLNLFVDFLTKKPKNSLLSKCSHVLLDEVHERNLKTDIIIGLIHKYISQNSKDKPRIKFLLSSATLNEDLFKNYFQNFGLEVIEIKGRTYPVKTEYLESIHQNLSMQTKVLNQIEKILEMNSSIDDVKSELQGHILVFLSDQIEINQLTDETLKMISHRQNILKRYEVLQLHGKLNQREQQRVFEERESVTKIIFSTNLAEASITIENVSIVIDAGQEKAMIFDPNRNSNILTVQNISRSQSEQRKGRAGRTRSGICYRLYTENQYNDFKAEKEPEILKTNLGFAILKIIELGVENVKEFKFLSRPSDDLIQNSLDTLESLEAIESNNGKCSLTPIGMCIIQTQLEPIAARIFIKASSLGVLDEVIKAQAVHQEYNFIFAKNRDFMRQILHFIEQSKQHSQKNQKTSNKQQQQPAKQSDNNQQNMINENNSDFLFMWRTFEFIENQFRQLHRGRNENYHFYKLAYKRISEYYRDAKQSSQNIHNYIVNSRQPFDDSELGQIKNQLMNNQKINNLNSQKRNENIVQSFYSGYLRQVAVYTGIHKLGFNNIQSNVMFYVHPSSSLNVSLNQQIKQANRNFQKGDILFFSVLEEREINNFAKCVSFFKQEWIKEEQIISKIEDKSNFEPLISLNGEKGQLEYFSMNELIILQLKLQNYSKNSNLVESKKGKYCVNFEKEYGRISFYCNPEMQPFIESLDIANVFKQSKQSYIKNLKKEQIIVRYKDSFNFAILKSGLQVKQILLPHQFLQVNMLNIPFKSNDYNIQKFLSIIQNPKLRKIQDFKIIHDYINKTSQVEFRFKNTKKAFSFFEAISNIDKQKMSKSLGFETNQIPEIKPISECNYYIESIKNLSKCIVRAQWSISPSLCYGQIYFSNEIDALATHDQLKKAKLFKTRFDIKDDTVSNSSIHIITVEKLTPQFDEVDLDAYIVNTYQGFMSAQIKREKMDSSFYRNPGLEESMQKLQLKNLIEDSIQIDGQFNNNNNNNNLGQNRDERERQYLNIHLRIQNGICVADIFLDSAIQAQELVDKLDGMQFGVQKLRLQIQNQQKILILGAVYKLYYEDIQQCILEASQVIKVKSPKLSEVTFLSKNIQLIIKQTNQSANHLFTRLQYQIKNIIKPDIMFLDCNPEDLEKAIESQYKLIQGLEKHYNCVFRQSSKRRSELKIWFKKNSTQKYIVKAKKEIKQALNEHLLQKLHLQKQNYHFKNVEALLQKLAKSKKIDNFEYDNKKITIKGTKSQIAQLKQELHDSDKTYLLSPTSKSLEDTCKICQEIKNLERLSCDCLFCKDCIYSFFLIQSQDKLTDKPLACPDHQDQPISLKIIYSVFDQQQIAEIIQIRIDNSIESIMNYQQNMKAFIRCPSVNCNEFFQRIYSQKDKSIEGANESSLSTTNEEIPSQKANKLSSDKVKYQEFSKDPPTQIKCYGCFQEYCLLSSGKQLDTVEQLIHHTHIQKTCEEYFKQLQLEQFNIKGINLIQCPKCKFQATKGEGCNHITCKCGAHFCAKCSEAFLSPKDVYAHLDTMHQGLYD